MTVNMSRAWLALSARKSLTPFLYQTRTLSASLARPHLRSRYSTTTKEADNEQQTPSESNTDADPSPEPPAAQPEPQPPKRRSYLQRRAAAVDSTPIRVERLGGLTRLTANKSPAKTEEKKKASAGSKRTLNARTMTDNEKHAFSELLKQLGADEPPETEATEGEKDQAPEKPQKKRAVSEEEQSEMDHISTIFESVLKDVRRQQEDSENKQAGRATASVEDNDELAEEMLSYSDYSVADITDLLHNNKISTQRAIALIIRRESGKTEAVFNEAVSDGKGDFAVWDICKERIFNMLQHLGDDRVADLGLSLDAMKPTPTTPTTTKAADITEPTAEPTVITAETTADTTADTTTEPTAEPTVTTADATETTADITAYPSIDTILAMPDTHNLPKGGLELPPDFPVEPVVVALYPKMLLVAFRLLSLHFPTSPLISQFRSTIKSHGRASAVLGGSTELYNELIYFYWRGCQDLPSVVSILQEMEVTGVEPDQRTCLLLDAVVAQRDRDYSEHRRLMRMENRTEQPVPWWDLTPNRKALRELIGPAGWKHRLERRFRERKGREGVHRTKKDMRRRKINRSS